MTIQEMHFDFKIKIDKIDSLVKRNFNAAQIDWLINEAQSRWVKQHYGLTNPKREGFESTQHRTQDLKSLHIKSPERQLGLTPSQITQNKIYYIDLQDLEFKHLFTTRVSVTCTKNGCAKTFGLNTVQTDDLNDALIDPFNKPNFKFGKVLGVYGISSTSDEALFIYSDDFTVDKVFVDYLKHPQKVWFGNYDYTNDLQPANGSNNIYTAASDNPVDCELSDHVHSEIIDEAVNIAAGLIEDVNLIPISQNRLTTNK